jgi:hypothetical protein
MTAHDGLRLIAAITEIYTVAKTPSFQRLVLFVRAAEAESSTGGVCHQFRRGKDGTNSFANRFVVLNLLLKAHAMHIPVIRIWNPAVSCKLCSPSPR